LKNSLNGTTPGLPQLIEIAHPDNAIQHGLPEDSNEADGYRNADVNASESARSLAGIGWYTDLSVASSSGQLQRWNSLSKHPFTLQLSGQREGRRFADSPKRVHNSFRLPPVTPENPAQFNDRDLVGHTFQ